MNTLQKYNLIRHEYETTFHKCSVILKENGLDSNIAIVQELHALTSWFATAATVRYEAGDTIITALYDTMFNERLFHVLAPRIDFYMKIFFGAPVHAHCFKGSDSAQLENPIYRCVFAFCDCCLYPMYISDYNCTTPRLDFFEVTEKTFTLFFPILKEMLGFCDRTLGVIKQ